MGDIKLLKSQKGQSIIELLIAMGVFVVIVSGTVLLTLDSFEANRQATERTQAAFIAQEGLEVARDIGNRNFSNLTDGDHGTKTTFGYWEFDGTSDVIDSKFTRVINIEDDSIVVTGPSNSWEAPSQTGTYDTTGNLNALDVHVANHRAYIVTEDDGDVNAEFYILDVSSPSSPSLLGSLSLGATGNSVYLSDDHPNYAFVATDSNSQELMVINISSPSAPTLAGSFNAPTDADALDIFINGNYAYLATNDFYILDITNPTSPSQTGLYDLNANIGGVWIDGNYAYLASTQNATEFIILDISTPGSPSQTGTYNISGNPHGSDIQKIDDYVYMSTSQNGGGDPEFFIFDVSTPASPSLEGSLNVGNDVNRIFVSSNIAYLATNIGSTDLVMLNVNTPTNIYEFSNFDLGGNANGVFLFSNYIYTATDSNSSEVEIVSHGGTRWTLPQFEAYYNASGTADAQDVFVSGNSTYLVTEANISTSSLVDTLEFDIGNGNEPNIIHVSGDIYAIAYRGNGNDGFLRTVEIATNGEITNTVIDTLEFDTSNGYEPNILHTSGNVYAVVYRGDQSDGYVVTVEIATNGQITDTVIESFEFETTDCYTPNIINISGNIYGIAFRGTGSDGFLTTVEIATNGQITDTVIDTLEYNTSAGNEPNILHVSGNVYAIAYRGPGSDGFLTTVEIATNGQITDTVIDNLEFDTSNGYTPNIIHVSGDVYVIAYRGSGADGFLRTVEIATNGEITNTVIDTLEFDTSNGYEPNILHTSGNVYAVVYRGDQSDGYVVTVEIATNGQITDTVIESFEFETTDCYTPNIINISGNIYGIAFRGNGSDGFLKTIELTESSSNPEFYIINVSDTENPSLTSSLSLSDSASKYPTGVYVSGDYAYVSITGGTPEMQVIDISTPATPSLAGNFTTPNSTGDGQAIFVSGNYAYLVTGNDGSGSEFYILDITTPASPSQVGSYDVGDGVYGVYVSGDYAYLATTNDAEEFLILDISTPATPTKAGDYNISGNPDGLAVWVEGDYAYVGTTAIGGGDPEFLIIDISTISSPILAGSINYNADIHDIYIFGDLAFLATDMTDQELTIVEVSDPSDIYSFGIYDTDAVANAVYLSTSGQFAHLATTGDDRELTIVEYTDDSSGGGTLNRKLITSTVTWDFTEARENTVEYTTYLTDWE